MQNAAWFKANRRPEKYRALGEKTIRAAVKNGELRVARIGAGRNYLLCDEYVDEYLRNRTSQPTGAPRTSG